MWDKGEGEEENWVEWKSENLWRDFLFLYSLIENEQLNFLLLVRNKQIFFSAIIHIICKERLICHLTFERSIIALLLCAVGQKSEQIKKTIINKCETTQIKWINYIENLKKYAVCATARKSVAQWQKCVSASVLILVFNLIFFCLTFRILFLFYKIYIILHCITIIFRNFRQNKLVIKTFHFCENVNNLWKNINILMLQRKLW